MMETYEEKEARLLAQVAKGPFLPKRTDVTRYFIVKVAGDTLMTDTDDNIVSRGDTDFFVATNRPYCNLVKAIEVAADLAMKSPGNRYYITKVDCGFMATEPRLQFEDYAGERE